MILDHINNLGNYKNIHPDFSKIAEYVRNNRLDTMPAGRYEIEGTDSFVMIHHYETKNAEEIMWESHRKYIDIQYVLYGAEKMGYMPVGQLTITSPYSEDKDVVFYKEMDEFEAYEVKEGYFVIFLPEDAHKPSCLIDEAKEVKKAIIKVPQNYV